MFQRGWHMAWYSRDIEHGTADHDRGTAVDAVVQQVKANMDFLYN